MSMITTKTIKQDGENNPHTVEVVIPFNDNENDIVLADKTLLLHIDISMYTRWKRRVQQLKDYNLMEMADVCGALPYMIDGNTSEVAAFMKDEEKVPWDAVQKFGDVREQVPLESFQVVVSAPDTIFIRASYSNVEGGATTCGIALSELESVFESYLERNSTTKEAPKFSREDFMEFWRSDDMAEVLTEDDRLEIFTTAPIGASDINAKILNEIIDDYNVENLSVIDTTPSIVRECFKKLEASDQNKEEDDEETDEVEIECEVNMTYNQDGEYWENEFQDYMYDDGSFVPESTRVGVEIDGELVLDKGISYASTERREESGDE